MKKNKVHQDRFMIVVRTGTFLHFFFQFVVYEPLGGLHCAGKNNKIYVMFVNEVYITAVSIFWETELAICKLTPTSQDL